MARTLYLLSLLTVTLISCGIKKMREEMPPPEVAFTDAQLNELGKGIEQEFNAGSGALFDARFDPVVLFSRMVWPKVPSEKEMAAFTQGYQAEVQQYGMGMGERLAKQLQAGGTTRFLRVARDKKEGVRLLFRIVETNKSLNYIELLVGTDKNGEPSIVDMYSATGGENLSRILQRAYVTQGGILSKLTEGGKDGLRKAAEASQKMNDLLAQEKYQEAVDYFEGLPADVKKQKPVQLLRVRAVMGLDDNRQYLAVLKDVVDLYSNDASMDLLQVDYFYLRKEYDSVLAAYDRLDKRFQDPYLGYMRALIHIEKGEHAKATELAEGLIRRDSTLMEPYYVLVSLALTRKDNAAVAAVLERLEQREMINLNFESIEKNADYADFVASEPYRQLKRKYQ